MPKRTQVKEKQSNVVTYNYPAFRVGILCDTFNTVDMSNSENILKGIKRDAARHKNIITKLVKNDFQCLNTKILSRVQSVDYEGPGVHSPSFRVSLMHNKTGIKYDVVFASTIILCQGPFKSKVWTRASLLGIDDKPAVNISSAHNIDFFRRFQDSIDGYASLIYNDFHSRLSKQIGKDLCRKIYTVEIKVAGTINKSVQRFFEPIRKERTFSVLKALKSTGTRKIVADCISVSHNNDIANEKDYRDLMDKYRDDWNVRYRDLPKGITILNNNRSISASGYQWFGYIYRNLPSLVLRTEDITEVSDMKSNYYGLTVDSPDLLEISKNSLDPKCGARVVGGGIIRDLTRTI